MFSLQIPLICIFVNKILWFLLGYYIHQFNDIGTYYFTSGKVDQLNKVEFRGVVIVEAKESLLLPVTVSVSGQEATTNSGSGRYQVLSCT